MLGLKLFLVAMAAVALYVLIRRKPTTYRLLQGFLYVFVFAFFSVFADRIAVFRFGDAELKMVERVREDAEDVRMLSEEVAALALFNARVALGSSTVDWVGPDVDELREVKRRTIRILDQAATNSAMKAEIEKQFDALIERRASRPN